MIKNININLDVVESMLYYWSAIADREKVNESFFVDIANMDAMKLIQTPEFSSESIRKVLSSIQNRELLSSATKPEKRFWSKNMWIAEDVSIASKMAQPVKLLNVDDLVSKLNEIFPENNLEEINIHITPMHLDPYYIIGNNILVNFFTIYFNEDGVALIDGTPIKEYIFELLCKLVESK